MKKLILLFTNLCFVIIAFAQGAEQLSLDKPIEIDGIEYSYTINNESVKEAGGKEMSRFEVTLYAKNKSGCLKIFLYEQRNDVNEPTSTKDDLAKFDCVNATGQRFTSKSESVRVRPFYTIGKAVFKNAENIEVLQDIKVQIGYALKPNEVISTNTIFIVPLNSKPNIQVRTVYNPSTF